MLDHDDTAAPDPDGISPTMVRACRRAAELLELLDRRNEVVGTDLFADPSWAMLLELLVSRVDGRRVSISSLCLASRGPNTTALRHLKALEERGFAVRESDLKDRRRQHVRLSPDAFERMVKLLG